MSEKFKRADLEKFKKAITKLIKSSTESKSMRDLDKDWGWVDFLRGVFLIEENLPSSSKSSIVLFKKAAFTF